MNFHRRDFHRQHSIANRNTGMGIRRRINQNGIEMFLCGLADFIHNLAFMIGLKNLKHHSIILGKILKFLINGSQGCLAVNIFFSLTQKIQVRAMDNKNFFQCIPLSTSQLDQPA